jgi:hypothetical protein
LLRSIVLPLEEQIVALKGKLRETDSLLQEYEKRQVGYFSISRMILGLLDPDLLVRDMDPDPSIIKQK